MRFVWTRLRTIHNPIPPHLFSSTDPELGDLKRILLTESRVYITSPDPLKDLEAMSERYPYPEIRSDHRGALWAIGLPSIIALAVAPRILRTYISLGVARCDNPRRSKLAPVGI